MTDKKRTLTINGTPITIAYHESVAMVDLMAEGDWEPELFRIFNRFLKPDRSYVDVGAFIGTSVVYGAQLARHCYAIEPNPLSYRYLVENTDGNPVIRDKVTRFEGCLWDKAGRLRLGAPVKPHGSSASLLKPESPVSWQVSAVTLEQFLAFFGASDVNFIKMDIEGAEEFVIPQILSYLRRDRPTLMLSLHTFNFSQPAETVRTLIECIDHYKYLYLRDGSLADRDELRRCIDMETHQSRCSDIIATDELW